jgi:hypothetical protein
MSVSYGGSSITFEDGSIVSSGSQGFKNKIINGAMMIDQRNAGASVTPNGTYTLDRWSAVNSQTGKFSVQQVTDAPTEFKNSLKVTSLSAYSIVTADYFDIQQHIEGFNIADLGWGTASAKTVTLSFWTKSSLTGTFGGAIRNNDYNYNYPFTYTISVADTWEYKTVTITGATSGTWLTTNGIGASVWFGLGVGATYSGTAGAWGSLVGASSATGATSVVGTNGATWQVTGVQLEKGTAASSFEFRSYTKELMLCQRYYWQISLGGNGTQYYSIQGYVAGTNYAVWKVNTPVSMRTAPALSISPAYNTGGGWNINVTSITNSTFTGAPSVINYDGNTNLGIYCPISTISTSYYCLACIPYCPTGTNNYMYFSSEL